MASLNSFNTRVYEKESSKLFLKNLEMKKFYEYVKKIDERSVKNFQKMIFKD